MLLAAFIIACGPAGAGMPAASEISGMVTYQFLSPAAGYVHMEAGADIIAGTTDGGRTWHQVLRVSGLAPAPTMQCIDAQHGYLFGQSGDPSAVMWQTSDRGAYWRSRPVPAGWNVSSLQFIDFDHGFVELSHQVGATSLTRVGCRSDTCIDVDPRSGSRNLVSPVAWGSRLTTFHVVPLSNCRSRRG